MWWGKGKQTQGLKPFPLSGHENRGSKKQIPFEDDRKKSNCNGNSRSFALLRMTTQ
jgi:hypothetical protein